MGAGLCSRQSLPHESGNGSCLPVDHGPDWPDADKAGRAGTGNQDDERDLALIPGGTWDVRGPYNENEWLYRVDLFGASEHTTELIPSTGIVHARYAVDPTRPWIGIAPLQWARLTGTLAANVETRLGEEAGAPVGSFIPIPDQQDAAAADSRR